MKHSIITTVKIMISIFLLWFLAHTSQLNFSLLPEMLHSHALLLNTLILYFLVIFISAWRWHKLNIVQDIQLSYRQTVLPTYLGIAFNNLLPGGVGGDFFRFYFINKRTECRKSAVMLSVLLDRITGLSGIFITVCLIGLLNINSLIKIELIRYILIVCASICLISAALCFAFILLPKKISLSKLLLAKFYDKKWLAPLISLMQSLRTYRDSKKVILECLLASVVIQILIAATCMMIAKMMHFSSISFSDYVIAIAVTQIANLIPVAPGGFGVGEMAFANIITVLNPGINGTFATVFLAYRIIGMFLYIPGVFVFIFERQSIKQHVNYEKKATT